MKLFPHVKYIAKVDDDVLLLPIHLRLAIQDYDEFGSDYISCMKRGKVLTENRYKWYEPQVNYFEESRCPVFFSCLMMLSNKM